MQGSPQDRGHVRSCRCPKPKPLAVRCDMSASSGRSTQDPASRVYPTCFLYESGPAKGGSGAGRLMSQRRRNFNNDAQACANKRPHPLATLVARCLTSTGAGYGGRGFGIWAGLAPGAFPDAPQHKMVRCWSGTHALVRIVDPVSAQHYFVSQCARDGGRGKNRQRLTARRKINQAASTLSLAKQKFELRQHSRAHFLGADLAHAR